MKHCQLVKWMPCAECRCQERAHLSVTHPQKKKKRNEKKSWKPFCTIILALQYGWSKPTLIYQGGNRDPCEGTPDGGRGIVSTFAPLLTCGRRSYGCKPLSADAWLSQPVWDRLKTLRRLLRLRLHTAISSGPLYLTSLCPWRDLAGPKAILLPRLSVVWHLNPGALCA